MRTSDADILIIPGLDGAGPDHWQSRWEGRLKTARRVDLVSWTRPDLGQWTAAIAAAVARAEKPVLCVAHSLGAVAVAHGAPWFAQGKVRGAMLVTPPSEAAVLRIPEIGPGFAPFPRAPLPFPSLFVASRSDPYSDYENSEDISRAWGAKLTDAGHCGHLNAESGHGPWPEGLMSFAAFLKGL